MRNATRKDWIRGFYLFVCIQLLMFIYLDVYCPTLNEEESMVISEFQRIKDPVQVEGVKFDRGFKNKYKLIARLEMKRSNCTTWEEIRLKYKKMAKEKKWDIAINKEENQISTYDEYEKNDLIFCITTYKNNQLFRVTMERRNR